jgi:hypothetical protein
VPVVQRASMESKEASMLFLVIMEDEFFVN